MSEPDDAGNESTIGYLNWDPHQKKMRHEFHLLDHYTAWCTCGWTYGTDYSDLNFTGSLGLLTQGYREHLD